MSNKIFERNCFIICPIGDESSPQRVHSDKLLNHVFKPVLDANQYNSLRADQLAKVGLITTQIINLIIESELVIADLTDQNPNVFYELALRHAINKPYIQVIAKGQKIPFDLSGIRTIEVDIKDLDDVSRAKKEIENQILEIENGHIPDSPISIATTARVLKDNDELVEAIASRISFFNSYSNEGYITGDSKTIETINRKLYNFPEYGMTNLEALDSKIDELLHKIDLLSKKQLIS